MIEVLSQQCGELRLLIPFLTTALSPPLHGQRFGRFVGDHAPPPSVSSRGGGANGTLGGAPLTASRTSLDAIILVCSDASVWSANAIPMFMCTKSGR